MARKSLIVVDDFYEDPQAIRSLALSQQFHRRAGAVYPGREAVVPGWDWSAERGRLRVHIDEPVDGPCPKPLPFPQGKFRIALAEDETMRIDRVHIDQQRWSAVVYLSEDCDCCDGLVLYRHRPTRSTVWDEVWFRRQYGHLYLRSPEEFRVGVLEFFRDPEQFERIGVIPMAFNRAVILMAHVFHGTGLAFGHDVSRGRLTQHFEFYDGPPS